MQNQSLPTDISEQTKPRVEVLAVANTAASTEITASAQAVADLLAQTQGELRFRNKRHWALFIGFATFGFLATQLPQRLHIDTIDAHTLWFVLPMFGIIIVWGAVLFRDMFRPVSVDFEALARAGGKQAIPVLMEALRSTGGVRVNSTACLQALIEYLPQLQVTDAALLKASDRNHFQYCLERLLTTSEWSELYHAWALAILKAYEQVGDATAIPIVERIANHKPRNEKQRQLRQAAQECLPLLCANAGGVDTTRTLLRPSLLDANAPDILLRAASSSTPAHEAELLRAANQEDTPPV